MYNMHKIVSINSLTVGVSSNIIALNDKLHRNMVSGEWGFFPGTSRQTQRKG